MAKKSNNFKLNLSLGNILTCAVYALIGLLLIILKGGSIGILMTVVGVLLIALGIVDVIKNKDLVKGIVEAAIGVVIMICGWWIADKVLLIFGILLIAKGVIEIWENRKNGLESLVSPIVTTVIGILLVFARGSFINVCCIIAGVIFLINAVLVLFGKSLK